MERDLTLAGVILHCNGLRSGSLWAHAWGRQYATLEIRGAVLGRHVGHDSCCCCCAVSQPARRAGSAMDSQSWFSGMWAGVGWWGISFVFLRRQYATLEIRGAVLGGLVGHDPCCCSGVSEPARRAGSAMDSQSWFSGMWAGVATSPQSWFCNGLSKLVFWYVGWCGLVGHKLCFFKASVRNVRDSGRRAGRSCWARSLLLFWCFGTGPQSWFCNGLSKLVSGMGWCSAMDSQSWFSGMWAGVAISPQSWFCNGLSKLVFWYVGWCGLVGHKLCFFKASVRNVRDSGRRAGRSCWARSLLLFWCFGTGPQSWFCNGPSKLVSGMGWCSAMDSQSWLSGMWAGVAISPQSWFCNGLSKLVFWYVGWCGLVGHKLCFFKASVRNVRDSGRRAGRSCWARSLLLFWCFGTGPQSWFCNGPSKLVSGMGWCSAMDSQSWFSGMWAGVATGPQSWFCNGLSKLVSGMGWCSAMDSQSWFSGMWAGVAISPQSWFCNGLSKLVFWYVGWCGLVGHKLCFFKASVRNVRDSGRRAGRSCWARSLLLFWCFGTGPQSWFCNGLSKLVSGMGWCSAMDSQSWFSGMWAGVATSPQSWFCNGLSKLVFWYVGWCGLVGHKLCFFKASVRNVRDSGRRAGRCCWARSLLLFWCFGIGPQSWFCNGLSKLVSGMGWCSAMDSQSWFSGMWAGVGWWGISFVFLRRQYATLEIRGAVLGGLVGHDPCCCSGVSEPARRAGSAMDSQSWFLVWAGVLQWTLKAGFLVCGLVSQPARRAGSAMDSQSWFSGMWAGVGWWGISFVFLRRQYATLEIRGAVLGGLVGHDPCCCSGVSEPARRAGSAMDSQSWFLVWAGVLQWTLKAGFLVCGLVSQPARRAGSAMDSQSWFSGMWAGVGWCGLVGHKLCFFKASVRNVRDSGRRAGRSCWARSLLLFWCFGTGPQSWFCNGLSKLVSGMGWCSAMDSQSWFSGMWAGVATSPQSWFCNGLSKLVFWYVGWCGLVGHKLCFFKASVRNVRDSGRRAGRSCWARSLLLFWCFGTGPQSWFCNGLSKLVSGMGWCSAMDSQSWFSGMWAGVATSPQSWFCNGLSKLVFWYVGWCGLVGHKLCFFKASVRNVRDSGRRAGRSCWARSLLLFWCFGIGPQSWFCNGLSKLVSGMGWCSAMDSQSWFSGMWAGGA